MNVDIGGSETTLRNDDDATGMSPRFEPVNARSETNADAIA
jgi:hypothetical protein